MFIRPNRIETNLTLKRGAGGLVARRARMGWADGARFFGAWGKLNHAVKRDHNRSETICIYPHAAITGLPGRRLAGWQGCLFPPLWSCRPGHLYGMYVVCM